MSHRLYLILYMDNMLITRKDKKTMIEELKRKLYGKFSMKGTQRGPTYTLNVSRVRKNEEDTTALTN